MRRSTLLPLVNSILCVAVIVVCLSVFLTRSAGVYAARATGESMQPTIPSDALLVISQRTPRVGDVIHVKNERVNYVHRLVELGDGEILTKGDNCELAESAKLDDVRGVVIFHAPFQSFLITAALIIGGEMVLAGIWSIRVIREIHLFRPQIGAV
jgi:signal peptidase I